MAYPPVQAPSRDEVVESGKRIDGGMVVHGIKKALDKDPYCSVSLLPSQAKKLVEGWASYVHASTAGHAEQRRAIRTALEKIGITSEDGWVKGLTCRQCSGTGYAMDDPARACKGCGGTGEAYVEALDRRQGPREETPPVEPGAPVPVGRMFYIEAGLNERLRTVAFRRGVSQNDLMVKAVEALLAQKEDDEAA